MTRRVLLLGGLDPSGGAGITLDAMVAVLHFAEPLPVAVALTVQGMRGFVRSEPVPTALVKDQVRALLDDGPVDVVKLGFVGDADALARLVEVLALLDPRVPLVVDPVLSATAGGLAEPEGLARAYVEHVVPRARVVTPNVPELAALAEGDAAALLRAGAGAVLVKGGHRSDAAAGAEVVDELFEPDGSRRRFTHARLDVGPVRGTGCAHATAIACRLGNDVADACQSAGMFVRALLERLGAYHVGLPRRLPLVPRWIHDYVT